MWKPYYFCSEKNIWNKIISFCYKKYLPDTRIGLIYWKVYLKFCKKGTKLELFSVASIKYGEPFGIAKQNWKINPYLSFYSLQAREDSARGTGRVGGGSAPPTEGARLLNVRPPPRYALPAAPPVATHARTCGKPRPSNNNYSSTSSPLLCSW